MKIQAECYFMKRMCLVCKKYVRINKDGRYLMSRILFANRIFFNIHCERENIVRRRVICLQIKIVYLVLCQFMQ